MLELRNYETIGNNYNYLTDMKMSSVCNENVIYLNNKYIEKETELNNLKDTSIENMWLNELQVLEVEYDRYNQERKEPDDNFEQTTTTSNAKKVVPRKKIMKVNNNENENENENKTKTKTKTNETKLNNSKSTKAKKNTAIKVTYDEDEEELNFTTKTYNVIELQEEEYTNDSID